MALARPSVTRRSRDYFWRWGWNSEGNFHIIPQLSHSLYHERRDQTEQRAVRLHEPPSYNTGYLKANTSVKARSSFCHAPLSLNAPRF